MFNFGENLKNLRTAKGLTQEQVAQLLDVSKQSVSRWENNITYPDITFLPALASFYCVTVDFLLGADHETNQATLADYESRRMKAHKQGDFSDAYELSSRLYTMFPNEKSVINNLMTDSYLMGLHNINHKQKHYLEMSIAVSERFLKMTEDMEEQCRCIKNISVCNKLLGNPEKSITWMKKLPSIWSGIEATALEVLDGQDKIDSIQCTFDIVLHLIYRLISTYGSEGNLSNADQIKVLEKIPPIFETFFENGDLGFYHVFLSRIYVELAKICIKDSDEYTKYTHKALEHAYHFDHLTPSTHTSILFCKQKICPDEFTKTVNQTQVEWVTSQISSLS